MKNDKSRNKPCGEPMTCYENILEKLFLFCVAVFMILYIIFSILTHETNIFLILARLLGGTLTILIFFPTLVYLKEFKLKILTVVIGVASFYLIFYLEEIPFVLSVAFLTAILLGIFSRLEAT